MTTWFALAFACSASDGKGAGPPPAGDSASDSGGPGGSGSSALVFDGDRPKNLLVITVDTLRRDYAGLFDKRGLTPNLTSIFSAGVVLENHRSCSNWTTPSFTCAQAGRFPFDDGYWPTALNVVAADTRVDWPTPNMETLASILTTAGYRTELITTNSMFSLEQNGGAYGFETETRAFEKDATVAVDLALKSAEGLDHSTPWYLHVHFMDPHGPYTAHPKYRPNPSLECSPEWDFTTQLGMNEFIWSQYPAADAVQQGEMMACLLNDYAAEIRYFDDELGRLWAAFDAQGLLDDTLVAFYSDHGEQFNEHNRFQHIWSLYSEENAASAAFWARNMTPRVWSGPTIHQDIQPTILNALGVRQGSHTGLIVGEAPDDRVMLTFNAFNGWGGTSIAVIQSQYKLMYWWSGPKRYYDLTVDPEELVDVYDTSDPNMMSLWDVLADAIASAGENWPELVPVDAKP